ncbi:MAG: flavodoxin family protein, partial [Treponema sp.]|nr:flavodoxin family protein [Treponema sp.]
MKILLINGSPKGKASNSLRLAHSFVEGLSNGLENKEGLIVDELQLSSMKIGACRGCFACWKNTPGHCCLKDDMQLVIQKEIEADLIIWSFPLYYFNVPGLLKNMIDRQLPMSLPFMSEREDGYGSGSHESRFDMKDKKNVLISTCGFYSAVGNYDSVRQMFNHFLGSDNYLTIFCGQGELFSYKELSERTEEYLSYVKAAGSEYAVGQLSPATQKKLGEYLYAKEQFEQMADASWGIDKETGEKASEELVFTRQMAAMYNKASYSGKDRV